MIQPELEVATFLYQAMSKLKLDKDDPNAQKLLSSAAEKLDEFKQLGWKTPDLFSLEVALMHLQNDDKGALVKIQSMVERGWQPIGFMHSSPLFDNLLNSPNVAKELAFLEKDYRYAQEQSDSISLAKLGL
jgi:hypothetical protein